MFETLAPPQARAAIIPSPDLETSLSGDASRISDVAQTMLRHLEKPGEPRSIPYMVSSLEELGLRGHPTYGEVLAAARSRGGHNCNPYLALSILALPLGGPVGRLLMHAIPDSEGEGCRFEIHEHADLRLLRGVAARKRSGHWDPAVPVIYQLEHG
jgi:hypothetical protein